MPKVLLVSEFSGVKSGYGVYSNELLRRLYTCPNIEVAELACYAQDGVAYDLPWRVYPVVPAEGTEELSQYQQNPYWAFGAARFDRTLLHFQPDVVLDIRDIWHYEYQSRSAFRPFFAHVVMPAVDATPQHKTWVHLYHQSDKVLTYTDWAHDVLREAGVKNLGGVASPCASSAFIEYPKDKKKELQQSLGLGDVRIIGTVMRNQGRKLFPELFRDFRKLLDVSGDNNLYLLCHTSSPDTFAFDELLSEHKVGSRVLFTYICRPELNGGACSNVEISFYRGEFSFCSKCGRKSSSLPNTQTPVSEQNLAVVYNLMDLYIQYASNEGFGMPMAEALSCGVPIAAIDYSAMAEVLEKSGGRKIKVKHFHREPETGRQYASPEPDSFINNVMEFFGKTEEERNREAALQKMSFGMRNWDEAADVWLKAILSVKAKLPWNAGPRNLVQPTSIPQNCSTSDFAKFLICNVLHEPEKMGTYLEARLIRDLDNGYCLRSMGGSYLNEDINVKQKLEVFNRQIALDKFTTMLGDKQSWEQRRLAGVQR